MARKIALGLAFFALYGLGCAPADSRPAHDDAEDQAALRTEHAGARALLDAVTVHAAPSFIECRTGANVSPRLELRFDSAGHAGAATVRFRSRVAGATREWSTVGTLEGIPRAGDLQGTITFTLGNENVAFDYYAEGADDANTLVFAGETIPLLCNAR